MGTIGTIAVGGGAWAVFKSANQVGTAMLLLIGAVLLLVGAQGTPLVRMGTSSASVELARLRERTRQVLKDADSEESPEIARGMVEAVTSIDPGLFKNSPLPAAIYESQVVEAVQRLASRYPDLSYQRPIADDGSDLVLSKGDRTAHLVIKYRGRGTLRGRDLREGTYVPLKTAGRPRPPTLVVTSGLVDPSLLQATQSRSEFYNVVGFVTWNDYRDDNDLARAVDKLLG